MLCLLWCQLASAGQLCRCCCPESSRSLLAHTHAGYSKTIVIVAGGALWLQEVMSMGKALGVGLAIAGLAWYSSAKLQESKKG